MSTHQVLVFVSALNLTIYFFTITVVDYFSYTCIPWYPTTIHVNMQLEVA